MPYPQDIDSLFCKWTDHLRLGVVRRRGLRRRGLQYRFLYCKAQTASHYIHNCFCTQTDYNLLRYKISKDKEE